MGSRSGGRVWALGPGLFGVPGLTSPGCRVGVPGLTVVALRSRAAFPGPLSASARAPSRSTNSRSTRTSHGVVPSLSLCDHIARLNFDILRPSKLMLDPASCQAGGGFDGRGAGTCLQLNPVSISMSARFLVQKPSREGSKHQWCLLSPTSDLILDFGSILGPKTFPGGV